MSVYRRALPESEPRLSAREIAERFGVYPESNLVRWLRDYPTIEGMVLPSAAYMSAALAQLQARQNLSGNIAEIGVYHGKHLAGLATSLKNGENDLLPAFSTVTV
ncbi:hypothetical protein PXJ20_07115 [Paraburkholderia sp. A1RI_3L]|uniref:hypothetical protein n=1 Tax=Paraburkholderia TaxID=1822464 RepID=UPI003B82963D